MQIQFFFIWHLTKTSSSLLDPTAISRSRRRRVMTYVIQRLLAIGRYVRTEKTQGKRRLSRISRREKRTTMKRQFGDCAIQLSLSPVLSQRVDTPQTCKTRHVHRGLHRGLHRDHVQNTVPCSRTVGWYSSSGLTVCRNNAPYFSQPSPQLSNDLSTTVTRDVRPGIN